MSLLVSAGGIASQESPAAPPAAPPAPQADAAADPPADTDDDRPRRVHLIIDRHS